MKILIVLTSHDELGNTGRKTGFWLEELAAKKFVALVCHAPGILTNVKAPDGGPIAKGRSLTGFTNSEESSVQLVEVVPYLLENVLKSQGANFSTTADWGVHVVQDGLLITGQNPPSSTLTAQALLNAVKTSAAA